MNLVNVPRDIRTQRHLREAFWRQPTRYVREWVAEPGKRLRPLTQNEYPTDVRCAWVDFVDSCARDGRITEALAQRATL